MIGIYVFMSSYAATLVTMALTEQDRSYQYSAVQFHHPFTCIVAGPTSCGKSVFVENFIKEGAAILSNPFSRIIWCYGEWQQRFIPLQSQFGVIFHEGLPDMSEFDGKTRVLIIIDDLMHEADGSVGKLFTKGSHHRNLSVIFITQNFFHQGRHSRDMSLNAHYISIFKNPRDRSQISFLARQLYPEDSKFLTQAYADATIMPHGYILLDLKQQTPDMLRVRSRIFTHEQSDGGEIVYIPAKRRL